MRTQKGGIPRFHLFLLIIVSTLPPLIFFNFSPIFQDEAAYAKIIDEFISNPSPIPHYMGRPVSWKPILGFALDASIISLFNFLTPGMPPEVLYRVPSVFFTSLSSITLFFITLSIFPRKVNLALLSSTIFSFCNQTIASSRLLLLDPTLHLFMLLSILFFLLGWKRRRNELYYGAAFFGSLAVLTKTFVAFLVPVLAYIFLRTEDNPIRKGGRPLLIFFISFPLTLLFYALLYLVLAPKGWDIINAYIYDLFFRIGARSIFELVRSNLLRAAGLIFPWWVPSLCAIPLVKGSGGRFLIIWLLLSSIPLLHSQDYFWYFLPIVAPTAILASTWFLSHKPMKSIVLFTLFFVLSVPLALPSEAYPESFDQREVGVYIAGRSALVISDEGHPAIVFYASHNVPPARLDQMVSSPYNVGAYTAYETLGELMYDTYERNQLENATSDYLRSVVEGYDGEYIVMDRVYYFIYSEKPSPLYETSFVPTHQTLFVIRKK